MILITYSSTYLYCHEMLKSSGLVSDVQSLKTTAKYRESPESPEVLSNVIIFESLMIPVRILLLGLYEMSVPPGVIHPDPESNVII